MDKTWIRPGGWGFVAGAVLTMIIGFSWGGWSTASTAERVAMERSNTAVTAALLPVCIEKSKADPARTKKLDALTAPTSSYEQRDLLVKDGWTSVGEGEGNRDVAEACVAQLLKVVAK
ncbi:MAG: hypothetical protein FJZ38_08920 [Candidatus Rokubacteria bacterium]|nr:hypothetical protein [Candidatus Rokubacteria bacterium]